MTQKQWNDYLQLIRVTNSARTNKIQKVNKIATNPCQDSEKLLEYI